MWSSGRQRNRSRGCRLVINSGSMRTPFTERCTTPRPSRGLRICTSPASECHVKLHRVKSRRVTDKCQMHHSLKLRHEIPTSPCDYACTSLGQESYRGLIPPPSTLSLQTLPPLASNPYRIHLVQRLSPSILLESLQVLLNDGRHRGSGISSSRGSSLSLRRRSRSLLPGNPLT